MEELFGVYTEGVIQLSVVAFVIIAAMMLGLPHYSVWAAHKRGQAELAQAQNEQQIQLAEANGRLSAAEANKKAAVIEAEAVALQIEKIGTNLSRHDLYLKWQWIKMMEETEHTTIYVPTEANIPILEARRPADPAPKDDEDE